MSEEPIEIILLGQPRGKGRPRVAEAGHVYTPVSTRDYEAWLKFGAQEVMGDRPPLAGPLRVDLRIVVPIARSWPKKRQEAARAGTEFPTKKPDLDNIMKMLDALNLVAFVDDAQIVETKIEKIYGDKPGLWVTVTPIETGDKECLSQPTISKPSAKPPKPSGVFS
ncbi:MULTISPECIES: RusA family crossover junction endodeoxyribonuclease [unclassified Aurantimonas]|uniref:RusA family crossover junction endodeoxyribonuclease n=1 Tax=unclassified Aurantimonas TaxID=2638230 RepID=UPI002E19F6AA|nr:MULTISPECIES: RusA family crossover junction endodeoxyribonuclease [unclassified Aurantimonas]MEC5291547.1 RusA family crossover junction endodeoxyribonuclease [Aurantimonas sp. C2-3-R2]MEC5412631.1 RusA family crossover junction endodeoxyribonuclease [Aurantimonas sp. C2-4-R8]